MLLRSFKIRAKESFNLIGFGIKIIQGDGVGTGTGTGNGFSLGSKPRGTIFFYLNILLALRGKLIFYLIFKKFVVTKIC